MRSGREGICHCFASPGFIAFPTSQEAVLTGGGSEGRRWRHPGGNAKSRGIWGAHPSISGHILPHTHPYTSFHILGGRSATVLRSELRNYASCRRRGTFSYDFLSDKLPLSEEQDSSQRCHRERACESLRSNSISCSRSQPEKDCSSQTHPASVTVIASV